MPVVEPWPVAAASSSELSAAAGTSVVAGVGGLRRRRRLRWGDLAGRCTGRESSPSWRCAAARWWEQTASEAAVNQREGDKTRMG